MGRKPARDPVDKMFTFRISEKEKSKLRKQLKDVKERLQEKAPDDEYKVTTNDIILGAIKKGLKDLKLNDLPKRNKREESY